ncbi:MAG: reverse transcriptase domain-containing protein [Candidatus Thiodiazotropha sp.]
MSCLGKLFTLIINNRLKSFAEKFNLIESQQAGFRANHSTVNNIFMIKSLIDLAKTNKNKLFCCFIDFQQAFDTVWRQGLWTKLDHSKINGKCLNIIRSMYENIKSKIQVNDKSSVYFPCCNGVRQGENLSPFYFLFI